MYNKIAIKCLDLNSLKMPNISKKNLDDKYYKT